MPYNTTQYVIPGTKFLRLASRKVFKTWGSNLQNVEKSMRRLYWADEGYSLAQTDQSGAEALIVAYLCRPGKFRELFTNKVKPHVFVALHLFKDKWKKKISGLDHKPDIDELCNTPIPKLRMNPYWNEIDALIKDSDKWQASERYYYIGKQVCHSSNYAIKAGAFCLNTLVKSRGRIVLSKRDAECFLDMYHALFPEIREWHREVDQQVMSTRMLFNLLGYPLTFTGDLEKGNALKEAYSAVPQSTVACITRQAYANMQQLIEDEKLPWDMLGDTHDSLFNQAPDGDEIIACANKQREFIEIELTAPRGEKFNMRSETAIGKNWGEYKKGKNEDGLKAYNFN